jgi:hypothetical protein
VTSNHAEIGPAAITFRPHRDYGTIAALVALRAMRDTAGSKRAAG